MSALPLISRRSCSRASALRSGVSPSSFLARSWYDSSKSLSSSNRNSYPAPIFTTGPYLSTSMIDTVWVFLLPVWLYTTNDGRTIKKKSDLYIRHTYYILYCYIDVPRKTIYIPIAVQLDRRRDQTVLRKYRCTAILVCTLIDQPVRRVVWVCECVRRSDVWMQMELQHDRRGYYNGW